MKTMIHGNISQAAELDEFEKEAEEMSPPPKGCPTKQYLVRDPHVAYGQP
uniref:Uncharacterized protein n=1 Tax=Romanomermis culicivorax TaxID=13658 RepID=A0A915HZW5_ROMCU